MSAAGDIDGGEFFSKYAPLGCTTVSAATKLAGKINPLAVQAIEEANVRHQQAKINENHR